CVSFFCFSFFFFSSRRRHTRSLRDWSSDVCSSDLELPPALDAVLGRALERERSRRYVDATELLRALLEISYARTLVANALDVARSEERRVGKECRSRWSPER